MALSGVQERHNHELQHGSHNVPKGPDGEDEDAELSEGVRMHEAIRHGMEEP